MLKTAILVDGGYYKKRAKELFNMTEDNTSAKDYAAELERYCWAHFKEKSDGQHERYPYRIYYYDCLPSDNTIPHPHPSFKDLNLKNTPKYTWTYDFYKNLKSKRKFALRMGILQDDFAEFILKKDVLKALCNKTITIDDLKYEDFMVKGMNQKGVDMKIGLDIASLANKKLADQIILIAGDSDFVSAAKHARREGIDFILDPMWQKIRPELSEHIDGIKSQCDSNGNRNYDIRPKTF